jgi:purine-nucleoside phosphorylase
LTNNYEKFVNCFVYLPLSIILGRNIILCKGLFMDSTRADYARAAEVIRARTAYSPTIGMVLGSGLGELADTLEDPVVIPYEDIPGWPRSTAPGHSGKLYIGRIEGKIVAAQKGRAHFYEGYSLQQVTFPIRVLHFLGVNTLILTNAAGGIRHGFHVGDLMLLNDHINFVGMSGANPLMGPNDSSLGERFLGMTHTYDRELTLLARRLGQEMGIPIHEGVYACLSGPAYETPAEIRMLRTIGADAVGMSTVHEVLVARHMGMRVLACSSITNICLDSIEAEGDPNEQEVIEAGKEIVPCLAAVIRGVLRAI